MWQAKCTWSSWMYFDYRDGSYWKENSVCTIRIFTIYSYEVSCQNRLRSCKLLLQIYSDICFCQKFHKRQTLWRYISSPAEVLPPNPPPPPEDSANPTLYRWQWQSCRSWWEGIFSILDEALCFGWLWLVIRSLKKTQLEGKAFFQLINQSII